MPKPWQLIDCMLKLLGLCLCMPYLIYFSLFLHSHIVKLFCKFFQLFFSMQALRLKHLNFSLTLFLFLLPVSSSLPLFLPFFLFSTLLQHSLSICTFTLLVAAQLNALARFNFLFLCKFVSHLQLTLIASYLLTHHDIRTYIYLFYVFIKTNICASACVCVCLLVCTGQAIYQADSTQSHKQCVCWCLT